MRSKGLVTAGFVVDVIVASLLACLVSGIGAWLFDTGFFDLLDGAILAGALMGWLINHRGRATAERSADVAIQHGLTLDRECANLTRENHDLKAALKSLTGENEVLAEVAKELATELDQTR